MIKKKFQSKLSNSPYSKFVLINVFLNYRKLEGFLALKHLTKKVVSQNFKLTDPIDKALFKQFRRVTRDTVLGLVSRILEIDEFVAVVDDADRPVGIVTHLDWLTFVADDSKAANTFGPAVSKTTSNGSVTGNGVQANGHSNDQAH